MENVIYNGAHSYNDVIREIKKLIYQGSKNEHIKEISEIINKSQPIEILLNEVLIIAFDSAVFVPSPDNKQQLRTVENILREQKANCTGYVTLIGAILENLKIPYTLRLVDVNGRGFEHIYIYSSGYVLDAILGQKQNGTETFQNRIQKPYFNYEVKYKTKIDYPMITTINGISNRKSILNRNNINGFWDTLLTPLLGNECELECNMKYASDDENRIACKESCNQMIPNPQYSNYGNLGSNANQTLLYVAGAVAITYFLVKKK
jgi:hypothetical protein